MNTSTQHVPGMFSIGDILGGNAVWITLLIQKVLHHCGGVGASSVLLKQLQGRALPQEWHMYRFVFWFENAVNATNSEVKN